MLTAIIANHKGGVGKTTTAVALASAARAFGRRALLVDADPQAQCATALGISRADGLYRVLRAGVALGSGVVQARPGLDLLPGDPDSTARPQKGRFRQQCEYVVWGTAGPMNEGHARCLPGFFTYVTMTSNSGKIHIAEKPLELMVDILQITAPGAVVLDPFMGSGATGEACIKTGRRFVGIEINPADFEKARARLAEAKLQPVLVGA